MSRMVSFFVLIAIIVVIGILFYKVMINFLVPLFLAGILVVMFHPLHDWMKTRKRIEGHPRLAAGLTTFCAMAVVLAPAILVCSLAIMEGRSLVVGADLSVMQAKLDDLRKDSMLEIPFADDLKKIQREFSMLNDEEKPLKMSDAIVVLLDLEQRVSALGDEVEEKRMDEGGKERQLLATNLVDAIQKAINEAEVAEAKPILTAWSYQDALDEATREYENYRLQLLGGPYKAWLKEFANENFAKWGSYLLKEAQSWLLSLGEATTALAVKLIVGLVIMVIAVYFFLVDGPAMTKSVMRLTPLDDKYERELIEEFDRVSRAVVLATLLSAVAQGVLAGVGFWITGVNAVFLLMLLTMVGALIPFVGAFAVWFPVCLWLFLVDGSWGAALFLAIYGGGVISMADNFIKPMVLHGQSNLHPLLALLSVLGGVQALGPMGIIVGPMVVVFLQTLLNILHRELMTMEKEKENEENTAAAAE